MTPEHVTVVEVGPRDGLQNERVVVSTADKIEFVDRLSAAHLPIIEVSAFVSPKWVPHMADAAEVFAGITRVPGIRYTALASMVKSCGLTIKDVNPLPFPGNNAPQAMIAGQVKEAVLHLNELIDVQQQLGAGKVNIVMRMSQTSPNTMYEMYGTLKSNLAKKRTAFVNMVAAQIAALRWMADPANIDKVAQLGTVVGDPASVMKSAMQQYFAMGFWTLNASGMPEAKVNNMIQVQIAVGNLTSANAPAYASIVDQSIYAEGAKKVSS